MKKKPVKYYRSQFWISKEQKAFIRKEAKIAKWKMSEVLRDIIDSYMQK